MVGGQGTTTAAGQGLRPKPTGVLSGGPNREQGGRSGGEAPKNGATRQVLAFLAGVLAVLAGVLAEVLPRHLLCERKRTKADSVDLLNRHVRATERTEQSITNKVT